MKTDGFHASTIGGKKVIAVSLALALVLASISVLSAFAAPTPKSAKAQAWGNQLRELDTARAWYNNARLNAGNFIATSDPTKAQQYLSDYAVALRQAEAIVAGHGTATTNNQSDNSNQSNSQTPAQQDLAGWLHMMRGLREKLSSIGFSASDIGSNTAGAGVPVTGGSTSSSGSTSNSGTTSNSNQNSTQTTKNSSNAVLNSRLTKAWGSQFRELETARAWYNNFRLNSKNLIVSSDPARTQQWLAEYAFALRQADAIIRSGGSVATNNNNQSSDQRTSAQQNVATWLHAMRSLREKLASGTNGPASGSWEHAPNSAGPIQ